MIKKNMYLVIVSSPMNFKAAPESGRELKQINLPSSHPFGALNVPTL